jgi:hypothetical protein
LYFYKATNRIYLCHPKIKLLAQVSQLLAGLKIRLLPIRDQPIRNLITSPKTPAQFLKPQPTRQTRLKNKAVPLHSLLMDKIGPKLKAGLTNNRIETTTANDQTQVAAEVATLRTFAAVETTVVVTSNKEAEEIQTIKTITTKIIVTQTNKTKEVAATSKNATTKSATNRKVTTTMRITNLITTTT